MRQVFWLCAVLALAGWNPASAQDAKGAAPRPGAADNGDLSALRAQVRNSPQDSEARYRLATLLSRRDRFDEALGHFRMLVREHPSNADYELGLGQTLLWSGAADQALAPLEAAIRFAPAYEDAHRALGQALMATGRRADAQTHYARAQERFGRRDWIVTGLARAAELPRPGPPPAAALVLKVDRELHYVEAELGHGRERLSNNPFDWTETYAMLTRRSGETTLNARLAHVERFGMKDSNATFAAYAKLAPNTTGFIELAVSPSHNVLPAHALHLQLAQSLDHGFGAAVGLKHLTYNATAVDIADLTLERYFGDFRVAYTYLPSRSRTAGRAAVHRLQGGYFYAPSSSVQLILASGSEVDRPDQGIAASTDVRTIALFGRHMFTGETGAGWSLSRTRQGNGTRDGISASLIRRF